MIFITLLLSLVLNAQVQNKHPQIIKKRTTAMTGEVKPITYESKEAPTKVLHFAYCYNSSLVLGADQFTEFYNCIKPRLSTSLSEGRAREITMFLSMTESLSEFRACTRSEKQFYGEQKKLKCFDLKTKDGVKRVVFAEMESELRLKNFQLF